MRDELILLVDDEANIIALQRLYLEREGFRVAAAFDGEAALAEIERLHPDLVVLDVMLPGVDGLEVCRRLRAAKHSVPILMVTARDEDVDRIVGLELGADDYLTKPFNPRELVARVKAILRRVAHPQAQTEEVVRAGELIIDVTRREVRLGDKVINLRAQEFELLLVFARQPGRVFEREVLLQQAWGYDFYGQTRTVDVHVAQLRRKLAEAQVQIETVTGVGYRLVVA
jgi:DNA-binding response OmpR family regulator